jgi:hypothetical protein
VDLADIQGSAASQRRYQEPVAIQDILAHKAQKGHKAQRGQRVVAAVALRLHLLI